MSTPARPLGITPAALLAAWAAVPEQERHAFVCEALTEEAADLLFAYQMRQAERAELQRRQVKPARAAAAD